jgi:PadR family transcriptional regulator PadR
MDAPRIRLSPQTLQLAELFLQHPAAWQYGYDLSRQTSLKSGTLYPLLMRLQSHGILETRWEAGEPGSPPRHLYRLSSEGKAWARECLAEARARGRRPTLSGARA